MVLPVAGAAPASLILASPFFFIQQLCLHPQTVCNENTVEKGQIVTTDVCLVSLVQWKVGRKIEHSLRMFFSPLAVSK